MDAKEVENWRERVEATFGATAPNVPPMFEACLRRTLDRTLKALPDGSVAVITGDIPAMWLRDSSTQMWPYLTFAATQKDGPIVNLIQAVSKRQMSLIKHDPYANAFNVEPDGGSYEADDDWGDHPADPLIWERKYEVDSLCFPVQLLARLVEATGRRDLIPPDFPAVAEKTLHVLEEERHHEERSTYYFRRPGVEPLDTLPGDGRGNPVGYTGLTWSGFRPSDDSCTYGYNIPANLLATSTLRDLASLSEDESVQARALQLATELEEAVAEHGVTDTESDGGIWAYEVDGLGQELLMDDANLPSLLSLPLLADIEKSNPLYQRTRSFVLSESNPFFYSGTVLTGIGSPHSPEGWVWPIALATQGLTSEDPAEARALAQTIAETTAGTNHVHESICCDDAALFTRPWFSWADSMFCLLTMQAVALEQVVLPGRQAD